jgi:hypothetical protein
MMVSHAGQEAIMTVQLAQQGIAPSSALRARSSLVRRLVQARDDPAKQRIRAWLSALDDEQLSGLGLTPEDITVLRCTHALNSSGCTAAETVVSDTGLASSRHDELALVNWTKAQ